MKLTIQPFFSNNQKKYISFYVNNKSQFDLSLHAVRSSSYSYYILFDCEIDSIENEDLPNNVKVVINHKNFQPILDRSIALITAVGHKSPVLPSYYEKLIKYAKTIKLPTIDVPHGLFQWGFNFHDDSKIIDLASNHFGSGGWVPTNCDYQIDWFSKDGPGYPKIKNRFKSNPTAIPEYTVITTNTNWYMYSEKHQRDFYINLFRYASKNHDELFIWSPHGAELTSNSFPHYIQKEKPCNILIYGLGNDIFFDGINNTEDLIACSKRGISTISTCLLDYEIFNKKVAVYTPDELIKFKPNFNEISCFSSWSTTNLEEKYSYIKSGMLNEYNVDIFDTLIKNIILDHSQNSQL